jgi:anthranilate phosphoribosyltransferase
MKKILNILFEHRSLTKDEAKEVLLEIGKGVFNEHELTAFMTVYLMRSITMPELLGFRDALLEMCIPIDLEDRKAIDIVGTGGDGKNTFNISTLSCFIVAGAGQMVAKHGSYGASSVSGASNLMDHIGYKFKNDQDVLRNELDQTNMCFLHAPIFHPALKVVAPIRKNLKVRTFFNMLGPMVNPANPEFNMVGVYNLEMARIYSYLLQIQQKNFMIINSLDGYDEVSLTSDTKIITPAGERIMTPIQLANCLVNPADIFGGDSVEEAATIFLNILNNKGTKEQDSVVISNAALALQLSGKYTDYDEAFAASKESLKSGKAINVLNKLISIQ